MTYLPQTHTALARPAPPLKRRRRTATSVLAGDFEPRPPRDILTSLLNGVKPYRPPLTQEEVREKEGRKAKRREMEKLVEAERQRRRKDRAGQLEGSSTGPLTGETDNWLSKNKYRETHGPKDFWSGRPSTSSDVTPDDLSDHSSSISQPSTKRPYTPPDDELDLAHSAGPSSKRSELTTPTARRPGRPAKKKRFSFHYRHHASNSQPWGDSNDDSFVRKEPKKRVAHKKGWKGWVAYDDLKPDEAPNPDKLIELDRAVILEDRRTRSGKNFDAISEGKDTWVK